MRVTIEVKAKAWDDDGSIVRECDVKVDAEIGSDWENENYYEAFAQAESLVKQALSCERRG